MSNSQQATQVFTVVAGGTIAAKRGVTRTATQATDGTSSAGVAIIGFSDHKVVAGEALRVNVGPTSMAESGAAIDGTERKLKTDASGRVIPWTSGGIVAALLQPGQTATGAGELVEVIPVVGQA